MLHVWELLVMAAMLTGACSELNHLGGQSLTIPDPRVVARMVGQGIAYGVAALLTNSWQTSLEITAGSIACFVLWAVWKWGPGFMAVAKNGGDSRDYTTSAWGFNYWATKITDFTLGVNRSTPLTPTGIRTWGLVYMTLRGILLYPLFCLLGALATPWAFIVGLGCLLQGIAYRFSDTVELSEYRFGAVIGVLGGITFIIEEAVKWI